MPLSEFYRMPKGKIQPAQQITNTCSTNPSHGPDTEFVELVWENGQIMMQGQSSRVRKSPFHDTVSSQTPKNLGKELGNSSNSKLVKFGAMDSVTNDFAMPMPSGELGLGQDDDMIPWLSYPIDDTLHHNYCSELLPELSGVTVNELSVQTSFHSNNKRNSFNQTIKDAHNVSSDGAGLGQGIVSKASSSGGEELSRLRSTQQYPWSLQHGQTSVHCLRKGVSGSGSNSMSFIHDAVCENSIQDQAAGGFPSIKTQKKDIGPSNTNSNFMNFSRFLKPAALVRANLQNIGAIPTPGSSGAEKMGVENKQSAQGNSIPVESAVIDSNSCLMNDMGVFGQSNLVLNKLDSQPFVAKPLDESCPAEQPEDICHNNVDKDNESPNQAPGPGASSTKELPDGENNKEPVVASSSVCSGNSVERASNNLAYNLKKRCREADDLEYRSEDMEEESVGVRKANNARGGSGSKRSRAAEVHNLSERRRRDRINEKMRALQELIPNCNKVDKASMLDEAIEYLKTLQLQVQMMSMGAGLYMPPMMLQAGMQRIHASHMTPFPSVGFGMGMGMGYGMGMVDMNGGSTSCPVMQVPPIRGAHFPAQTVSGANSFHGFPGSNLQVFGHLSQGIPMSMPRPPLVPSVGHPPTSSASFQMMHNANANASGPTDQKSSQCHATNEGFDQTALVSRTNQAADGGGSGSS